METEVRSGAVSIELPEIPSGYEGKFHTLIFRAYVPGGDESYTEKKIAISAASH